jgi:hypothetical protein
VLVDLMTVFARPHGLPARAPGLRQPGEVILDKVRLIRAHLSRLDGRVEEGEG